MFYDFLLLLLFKGEMNQQDACLSVSGSVSACVSGCRAGGKVKQQSGLFPQ